MSRLERGEQIALVSDAGTPAISDPGYRLAVEAIRGGIPVIPIPGASALTALLSAGALPADRFVFDGFPPAEKQARRARLRAQRSDTRTVVIYASPHRLPQTP